MPTKGEMIFAAFDQEPKKAIELLKKQGIDITVRTFEDMMLDAEKRSFVLAKVMQADILQDVKDALEKAMEDGVSFGDFKKSFREVLQRRGWEGKADEGSKTLNAPWRIETIYRTNLQSALQAGRYLGQLAVKDTRPYLQYYSVVDNRTSPVCLGLDGRVERIDSDFWNTYYPPNHFRCRARTATLSEKDLERMGIAVMTDKDKESIAQTGKGFDHNPIENYEPDMSKYSKDIGKQLKEGLG